MDETLAFFIASFERHFHVVLVQNHKAPNTHWQSNKATLIQAWHHCQNAPTHSQATSLLLLHLQGSVQNEALKKQRDAH